PAQCGGSHISSSAHHLSCCVVGCRDHGAVTASRVPSRIGADTVHRLDITRGVRVARTPREWLSGPETAPGGRRLSYPLLNQSTAFHVGPAWVGLAKKLPSFGPTRSTFLR